MINVTKSQLTELFNGSKTWEVMAEEFTAKAGIPVSSKMVQQMFKDAGFNLRTRKSVKPSWFTVIDDLQDPNQIVTPETTEIDLVETDEVEDWNNVDSTEEVETEQYA